MLSNRIILQGALKKQIPLVTLANQYGTEREGVFGNREWVGHGQSPEKYYTDRRDFPLPAMRWKEIKGDLIPLREKEKGDWKKLTLDEKKVLYRASFCQTLVEADAPTGEWKYILGHTLIGCALAIGVFILIKFYAGPPKPDSFSEESRARQLRGILDLKIGGAHGTSSKWDYEKDDWKK